MTLLWRFLDAIDNAQIERVQELYGTVGYSNRVTLTRQGTYLALMNRKYDLVHYFLDTLRYTLPRDLRNSMLRSTMHTRPISSEDSNLFRLLIRSRFEDSGPARDVTLPDIMLPIFDLLPLSYAHGIILDERFGRENRLDLYRVVREYIPNPQPSSNEFTKHVRDGNIARIRSMIETGNKTIRLEDIQFTIQGGHVAVLRLLLRYFIETVNPITIQAWKSVLTQMIDLNVPAALFFVLLKHMRQTQTENESILNEMKQKALNVTNPTYLELFVGAGMSVTYDDMKSLFHNHRDFEPYERHLEILVRSGLHVTPEMLDFAFETSGAHLFLLQLISYPSDGFFSSEQFMSHLLLSPNGLDMIQELYHEEHVLMPVIYRLNEFISGFGDQITDNARKIFEFTNEVIMEDHASHESTEDSTQYASSPQSQSDDDIDFSSEAELDPISPNETMQLYLHFFETFCEAAALVDEIKLDRFRHTLLACSDVLGLSVSDTAVLRRRNDRQALCQWMTQKQSERLQGISSDTNDPITYSACSDIPLLFLVVLHNQCFEITSLWTYLQNDHRNINPSTRQKFTDVEVETVNRRYEATLQILNGLREMVQGL